MKNMKRIKVYIIIVLLHVKLGFAIQAIQTSEEKETVVMLHGLFRSNSAMWLLANRVEDAGYEVIRIEYKSFKVSPNEIIKEVSKKIDEEIAGKDTKVHFVGHSLGGLMIRAYLAEKKPKRLGRVVLLGSPSKGTDFVDKFRDRWWMKMLGETTLELGKDGDSFHKNLPDPDYPLGIIAGKKGDDSNDDTIPGEDDGIVPVESTKVDGMADMIVMETSHAMLRYNKDVAKSNDLFFKTW